MRPIAGSNGVAAAGHEVPRRREKSINRPDRDAIEAPTQNERHVVRVSKSRASTDVSVDIRSQIIFGEWQGGCRGVVGSAKQSPLAYPDKGIQVQEEVVLAVDRKCISLVIFRLVARVVNELGRVGETWRGSDPGIYCAHSERINAAILPVRQGDSGDQPENHEQAGASAAAPRDEVTAQHDHPAGRVSQRGEVAPKIRDALNAAEERR